MPKKMFPVIWPWARLRDVRALKAAGCPRKVPWALLAPHEAQAQDNHDQSLKTLASRGGLDPVEMVAVLTDQTWRQVKHLSLLDAVAQLKQLIDLNE